ncbi:hypothetical protein TNCT_599711 [Trichonephila clavata]|uniref:Uncharacterized protein n=1 Tax=Trichonephila clavata TaxID=2740835 RepID=A0A8X6M4J2_TRICU|nr:hypothetical protein TNCT_599711 [Trichonephila clavata]
MGRMCSARPSHFFGFDTQSSNSLPTQGAGGTLGPLQTHSMKRVSTLGREGKMHGLQANGTFFRHAKHGIWKRSTKVVQKLQSRMTQRHPLFQILRAPIPAHGRLSVQIGFHAFCPDAPNVGAVTPFGHLVEHKVLGFERFDGEEKGERAQFSRFPEGQRTLHKASRSWKCCRKAFTVNTSGMGKAFRRFRNSFKKAAKFPKSGDEYLTRQCANAKSSCIVRNE